MKWSRLFLGAAAALFAGFCNPATASAQNLLQNGGFETGDLVGWDGTVTVGGWNAGNWTVMGLNPQSGSFNARNNYDGGIGQQVGVQGGKDYVFSGAAFIPSTSAAGGTPTGNWGSFVQLDWYNASGIDLDGASSHIVDWNASAQPKNQWNTFSFNVHAPNAATSARVLIGTYNEGGVPANPTEFDSFNLHVASVPEPGTCALLATGLLGLIPILRRRSRG